MRIQEKKPQKDLELVSELRVIGVIHLLPLPGTPWGSHSLREVLERALQDAWALKEGGVDTAILENFGDAPFQRQNVEPHIVACMTVIAERIIREVGIKLGINVLRNDAKAALGIAQAVDAEFIRVNIHTGAAWTDQGLIQGEAYQTLLYRKQLGVDVDIAADILVKHASSAGNWKLLDAAKDTMHRGGASFLIITGSATGATVDWEKIRILKEKLPNSKLWIGSGMTPEQLPEARKLVDAVIVGTYFHKDSDINQPLCTQRVEHFIKKLSVDIDN